MTSQPEFSKLRSILFPIHPQEMKKFLPMGFMLLLILFNYTVLRNTKDALIATASGAGVEAIPYIKGLLVTTSAIGFVILYTKLSNLFSQEKLFYIVVTTFLVFFGVFSFVLYPNLDTIHPSLEKVQALQEAFPRFKFLFSLWAVWTYSLYYVLAELWGSAMISLLFWQFANEVVRSEEAKRFYPLFVLLGNVALILSGYAVTTLSQVDSHLVGSSQAWGDSLKYIALLVVGTGLLTMMIYRWMQTHVLTNPLYYDAAGPKKPKKEKPKMGIMESFLYIFTNPYIGLIALLVLSYGMSINLVEFIWKKQLAIQFKGNPNGYNTFMGNFSSVTGIATILIIFFTKNIVRRFGWFVGAIITPTVLALTGALFFALILLGEIMNPVVMALGFTSTYMAVIVGATQNFLTKGAKYSFFDPTKEMSYIPLDQELKTKGKAVVDVIGGRLGKAAGGYTIIFLFMITAAQDAILLTPYLGFFVALVVFAWIFGVIALNKRYTSLIKAQAKAQTA